MRTVNSGGAGEDGRHVHEVAPSEPALGLRPDEEHAPVAVEEVLLDQVPQDRLRARPERIQAVPPLWPELVADSVLLQAEREHLLGDDVAGLGRCHDRLDPAAAPQREQPGGVHERRPVDGEEQAVAGGAGSPAGAAESLQERRHRAGSVDLDDPVQVADVDAELQGAGRDDDAVARLGEGLLGAAPFVGATARRATGTW